MSPENIRRLNAINRAFYAQVAAAFDETRERPWAGWARLTEHVPAPARVLDLGCGNGRWGVDLAQAGKTPLVYHGVDSSAALLAAAQVALARWPAVTAQLWALDLLEGEAGRLGLPAWEEAPYDAVVAFGVLHHIPSQALREDWVRAAAACVKPGGVLCFATWRFADEARLRARLLPLPPEYEPEAGDWLLDWRRGAQAWRYCHHHSEHEHDALVDASGLDELERYRADAHNVYSILRRP